MMAKRVFVVLLFVVSVLLIVTVGGSMAQEGTDRPHDATIDLGTSTLPEPLAIMATQAITVEKAAETPVVDPDGDLSIAYVVTFTNDAGITVTLDRITDTLPGGFEFWGMAAGSGVAAEPTDKDAPTIVWQGPFAVPNGGTLLMRYWIEGISTPGVYTNKVKARISGGGIVSATADVTIQGSMFAVEKRASAETIAVEKTVDFDVTITNASNVTDVVAVVSDTLPTGLVYQEMTTESDVSQEPAGTTGTIVWTGPFTISPGAELHLIYQVRADETGTFGNSVVGQDAHGKQFGPAQSQVVVGERKIFLPLVYSHPQPLPPPDPLNEDFLNGVPDEWTPFVNWPELNANQWKWRGDGENWGRLDFLPGDELEQWSLNMYLGEGAQDWTDYRVEAKVRAPKDYNHPLFGVWFRGTYEERTDNQGGIVGGYMVTLRPDKNQVYLQKIDANTRQLTFKSLQSNWHWVDTNEWYEVVIEVQGGKIMVWIDGENRLGVWDETWGRGTVGFGVFRGHGGIDSIRVTKLDPLPTGLQMAP